MKLVNWNIEWMNNWFVGGNEVEFRNNYESRGDIVIEDVKALAEKIANVIKVMNPDVLTVQEGPSDIHEMKLFSKTFLIDDQGNELYDVYGGFGSGAQKQYGLVKKNGAYKNAEVARDPLFLELEELWDADVDGDLILADYKFTRPPLILTGEWSEKPLIIIALHTKSKFVQNQMNLWNNENTRIDFIRKAMKNRRRISAEGFRLRRLLNDLMVQNPQVNVIVTGDWNDGPGNDYFERNYLTHNVSDIVLGSTFYPHLMFKHTFLERLPLDKLYTAIFDDFIDQIINRKILLDHIIVSPALENFIQDSGIEHDHFEAAIDHNASTSREKEPSDHRPVFIKLS